MYQSLLSRLPFVAMLCVLFSSTSVLAATTISITPSGDSSYSVMGSGLDGVAGIQFDITYDAALAPPTVTQGGAVTGAMFAANTSRTGLIKIGVVSTRAFSGSGQIAAISFVSKTGSSGITSVTASMIDSTGAKVPVFASVTGVSDNNISGLSNTPGVPFSQTSQTDTATSTYLGTVVLPTDQQQRPVSPPEATSNPPVDTREPTPRTAEQPQLVDKPTTHTKPAETSQYVVYKGILDRFRLYTGSKKLSAYKALFDKNIAQAIQQQPALLVNNGQSKAVLTVDIPASKNSSLNFAVNGGVLVAFKQDKRDKNRWMVEVLPDAGTLVVTLTILSGNEGYEYPLTVVPPVKTTLTFDERGWNRFLKEVGTAKAPLNDLNKDGVRDYKDEFIFVANCLSSKVVSYKRF